MMSTKTIGLLGVMLVVAGCPKKNSDDRRAVTEEAVTAPTCEAVCKRQVDCLGQRMPDLANTKFSLNFRQLCEEGCPARLFDDDLQCWMTTACSNIPDGTLKRGECPELKAKIDEKRRVEKEAEQKRCKPIIASLGEAISRATAIELTEPVLEGLVCVTTTLDVPESNPQVEDMFPALKEKLAAARDDFERYDFRAEFEKANAAAIDAKRKEREANREAVLAPLWAALERSYWIEVPAKLTCNYGACDVDVKTGDIPDVLYKWPFRLIGTYEKKKDDLPHHPYFYKPENSGLPPQRFGVASGAIATKAREVDRLRVMFTKTKKFKGAGGYPNAYFEPVKYRFCVSTTRKCSGWIDSHRYGLYSCPGSGTAGRRTNQPCSDFAPAEHAGLSPRPGRWEGN